MDWDHDLTVREFVLTGAVPEYVPLTITASRRRWVIPVEIVAALAIVFAAYIMVFE